MFTGIITHKAVVHDRVQRGSGARMSFRVNEDFLADCREGDSIAVSGVCLTALDIEKDRFSADVSVETLDKTTLGHWKAGREVNLEKSLRAKDRLGGHMVSGHVDGRGRLLSDTPDGDSHLMQFGMPAELARYVAVKGSIGIDGISLTVNEVFDDGESGSRFTVCIIPHTLEVTALGSLEPGGEVNLEVDMIARYLERLQAGRA